MFIMEVARGEDCLVGRKLLHLLVELFPAPWWNNPPAAGLAGSDDGFTRASDIFCLKDSNGSQVLLASGLKITAYHAAATASPALDSPDALMLLLPFLPRRVRPALHPRSNDSTWPRKGSDSTWPRKGSEMPSQQVDVYQPSRNN
jgi:hypothetical protein